jgi:hypothetical protein
MRFVAIIAALAPAVSAAAAQAPPDIALIDTAVLAAPLLRESSGVTPSARRPGLFWSLNDSGNRPLLFVTDSTGRDLGYVRVAGARTIDWEELTSGPCPRQEGRCLFIGDIGDNNERRRHISIYVLPEPDPPVSEGDTLRSVAVTDSLLLRYPRANHDAEAMAIGPDRSLLIITKDRWSPPVMFRAPIDSGPGPVTMQRVGELPIAVSMTRGRLVTGAAISPDGRWLAVRTYISLHFFRLGGAQPEALTDRNGIPIPVIESQGEAISFDGNERLVLTSERGSTNHAIFTRLRLLNLQNHP